MPVLHRRRRLFPQPDQPGVQVAAVTLQFANWNLKIAGGAFYASNSDSTNSFGLNGSWPDLLTRFAAATERRGFNPAEKDGLQPICPPAAPVRDPG
jgi:hypothetical protein